VTATDVTETLACGGDGFVGAVGAVGGFDDEQVAVMRTMLNSASETMVRWGDMALPPADRRISGDSLPFEWDSATTVLPTD
jgi:hypothetical protein